MPFDLFMEIDEITGNIRVKYRYDMSGNIVCETTTWKGKFEHYCIIVREAKYANNNIKYYLEITGSLHKNHQKGHNFKRFYFSDCCKEIKYLCDSLQLDSKQILIETLEFGVNIKVDFSPYEYFDKHLISYKSKRFDRYRRDNKSRRLGFFCDLEEYSVKLYDKGLQNGLEYHLMRFEYRIIEMHDYVKSIGIRTLNDLMNKDLVINLIDKLLDAWDNVYLFEEINTTELKLTPTLEKILPNANNNRYWQNLHETNPRKYRDYRNIYKKFIAANGRNYNAIITAKIVEELKSSFNEVSSIFGVKVKSENRRTINSVDSFSTRLESNLISKPPNYLLTKCSYITFFQKIIGSALFYCRCKIFLDKLKILDASSFYQCHLPVILPYPYHKQTYVTQ